jgi:hypothetical protein
MMDNYAKREPSYREGYKAAQEGKPRDDNPNDYGTYWYSLWQRGHDDYTFSLEDAVKSAEGAQHGSK